MADEDEFADMFAMMKERCASPPRKPPQELPAAKRPRTFLPWGEGCDEPGLEGEGRGFAAAAAAADAASPSLASPSAGSPSPLLEGAAVSDSTTLAKSTKRPETPPDKVIEAYALLDVPLSASAGDIERKSRRLARGAHPDKVSPDFPEQRAAAEVAFRKLQEAKAVALAWVLSGEAPEDSNGAENSEEEASSCMSDPEIDERRQELKACGMTAGAEDGWNEACDDEWDNDARFSHGLGDPAAEDDDDDEKPSQRPARGHGDIDVADISRSIINIEDNALAQARALTSHLESQRREGMRTCEECFCQLPADGPEVCKKCKKELDKLDRTLLRQPK